MRKKKILLGVLVLTALSFSFGLNATYAYWGGTINDSSNQRLAQTSIGTWNFKEKDSDIVSWGVLPGIKIAPGNGPYVKNDLVYYNGNIHMITGPLIFDFQIQNFEPWGIKIIDFEWHYKNLIPQNKATLYNGEIYLSLSTDFNNAYTEPSTSLYWKPMSNIAWIPGKQYAKTVGTLDTKEVVTYNGRVFKVTNRVSNVNASPDVLNNGYSEVLNPGYVQPKNYIVGDIVTYSGGVYEAVNAANASATAPGTTKNAWKRLDNITYHTNHAYQLYDVVYYNGFVYQVVNEANANAYAPETLGNAWNRLDTFIFQEFNVYSIGDVVVSNGHVYRSIINNNMQAVTNTNAWFKYE